MTLIIRKLDTSSRRDVNRFIDLPFRIYRDCPQWVPPLVDDVKLMLNRKKYPFYEHSDADFFVAEREGRLVARIAVLENRHYNEHARAGRPSSTSSTLKTTPRPRWRSSSRSKRGPGRAG